MPGVQFQQTAALSDANSGLSIGVQLDGLTTLKDANSRWTREALQNIKTTINSMQQQLSEATDNIFPEIAVLGDGGELIGWIGARDGFIGGWFKQLYVGGTDPTNAPLFADANGNVIIGQNGSISVRDLGNNEVGWEGVRTDSSKAITAATNASPVVVTITAHGYVNGDTVFITGAIGNAAINGYRIVENVTANTFTLTTLAGAIVNGNGVYSGSATATRYFAGAWFQSFAIGGSGFSTSKIRGFADGTVVINASFIVDSNGATTSINNSVDGSVGIVGVRVKNDTPPSQDILMSDTGFFIRASDQIQFIAQMNGAGDSGQLRLSNLLNEKVINLSTGGGGAPFLTVSDSVAGTSVRTNAASVTATNVATISTLGDTTGAGVVALRAKSRALSSQDIEVSDTGYYIRASDQFTYVAQMNGAGDAGQVRLSDVFNQKIINLQTSGGGSPFVKVSNSLAGTSVNMASDSVVIMNSGTTATLGGTVALRAKSTSGFSQDIEVSDTGYFIRATDQFTYVAQMNASGNSGQVRLSQSGGSNVINIATGGGGAPFVDIQGAGGSARLGAGFLNINGQQVLAPRQPAITVPSGGGTIDTQARTAINQIIGRLLSHGLTS